MRWHLDRDPDVEITMAVALDVAHTFPFQAENAARLGSRGDAHRVSAIERRNVDLCSERCLHIADWHLAEQVVTVPLENFVRLNMEDDVQIPMRPAPESGLSVAGRS